MARQSKTVAPKAAFEMDPLFIAIMDKLVLTLSDLKYLVTTASFFAEHQQVPALMVQAAMKVVFPEAEAKSPARPAARPRKGGRRKKKTISEAGKQAIRLAQLKRWRKIKRAGKRSARKTKGMNPLNRAPQPRATGRSKKS